MARLVVPQSVREANARFAAAAAASPPDTYKDRLVKYIPAEAVAFYAFTDKMIASKYKIAPGDTIPTVPAPIDVVSWVLLILGIVLTPIYLRHSRVPGQPWKLHATISTIAFVFWAYTLEGSVFVLHGWYDVFFAALFAPVFTFVAGAIEPKPVAAEAGESHD